MFAPTPGGETALSHPALRHLAPLNLGIPELGHPQTGAPLNLGTPKPGHPPHQGTPKPGHPPNWGTPELGHPQTGAPLSQGTASPVAGAAPPPFPPSLYFCRTPPWLLGRLPPQLPRGERPVPRRRPGHGDAVGSCGSAAPGPAPGPSRRAREGRGDGDRSHGRLRPTKSQSCRVASPWPGAASHPQRHRLARGWRPPAALCPSHFFCPSGRRVLRPLPGASRLGSCPSAR